jgi:hypothetical protein
LPLRGPKRVKEFSISHWLASAHGLPASPV